MSQEGRAITHLTEHQIALAKSYEEGLGTQALQELLSTPPETQIARLEQFEAFVHHQRQRALEKAQSKTEEMEAAVSRTTEQLHTARLQTEHVTDQLHAVQMQNDQLSKAVDALASAKTAAKKRVPVRMDCPKFDGSDGNKLVHWLLAVQRSGVAQLITDDDQMVAYAMSNLRGKAAEWAYSTLLTNVNAFDTWTEFNAKIRAMYQPPNKEVLLQGRFFSCRQGKRTLQQYVQEMRTLSASITEQPLSEAVKVPAFMNGLRQGPARQALFRKVPPTMEDAINIAFIEEQSFNVGLVHNAWTRPTEASRPAPKGQSHGPTPMELCNTEVVCYNCGKKGHIKSRCTVKPQGNDGTKRVRFGSQGRGGRHPSAGRTGRPSNAQTGNGSAQ